MPGDTVARGIKRLVQVTGILVGVASGQPLLVNACVKSLTHDIVSQVAREMIGDLIGSTLRPAGSRWRELEPPQGKTERAREMDQIEEKLDQKYVDRDEMTKELTPERVGQEEITLGAESDINLKTREINLFESASTEPEPEIGGREYVVYELPSVWELPERELRQIEIEPPEIEPPEIEPPEMEPPGL